MATNVFSVIYNESSMFVVFNFQNIINFQKKKKNATETGLSDGMRFFQFKMTKTRMPFDKKLFYFGVSFKNKKKLPF